MSNQPGDVTPTPDDPKEPTEINLDEIDPNEATPEQVESVITYAKTHKGLTQHWHKKAEKAGIDPETGKPWKDVVAELKTSSPKTTPPAESDDVVKLKAEVQDLKLSDGKRILQHELGISPEETDLLVQQSGGDLEKAKEVFKTDFFQAGLNGVRAKRQTDGAIPSPSSRVTKVEGKTFEEMSPQEQKKNWSKVTGAKN